MDPYLKNPQKQIDHPTNIKGWIGAKNLLLGLVVLFG